MSLESKGFKWPFFYFKLNEETLFYGISRYIGNGLINIRRRKEIFISNLKD